MLRITGTNLDTIQKPRMYLTYFSPNGTTKLIQVKAPKLDFQLVSHTNVLILKSDPQRQGLGTPFSTFLQLDLMWNFKVLVHVNVFLRRLTCIDCYLDFNLFHQSLLVGPFLLKVSVHQCSSRTFEEILIKSLMC